MPRRSARTIFPAIMRVTSSIREDVRKCHPKILLYCRLSSWRSCGTQRGDPGLRPGRPPPRSPRPPLLRFCSPFCRPFRDLLSKILICFPFGFCVVRVLISCFWRVAKWEHSHRICIIWYSCFIIHNSQNTSLKTINLFLHDPSHMKNCYGDCNYYKIYFSGDGNPYKTHHKELQGPLTFRSTLLFWSKLTNANARNLALSKFEICPKKNQAKSMSKYKPPSSYLPTWPPFLNAQNASARRAHRSLCNAMRRYSCIS